MLCYVSPIHQFVSHNRPLSALQVPGPSDRGSGPSPHRPLIVAPPLPGPSRPADLPGHSGRSGQVGTRLTRRLPSVLTGEPQTDPEPRAGTRRRPRDPAQVIPGHCRSAAGAGSGGGRREDGRRRESGGNSGRSGTRRKRRKVVDRSTSTEGAEIERGMSDTTQATDPGGEMRVLCDDIGAPADHIGAPDKNIGAATCDRGREGATRPSDKRLLNDPPRTDLNGDESVMTTTSPASSLASLSAREARTTPHPRPPPPRPPPPPPPPPPRPPTPRPSTPKRPRPDGGSVVDALLDRLMASPIRRPPPSRPRPRPAAAPAGRGRETDLISGWLRDGKVSIVE